MIDIKRLKVDAAYWDEVAPEGAQWFGPGGDGYKEGWYRMMPGEGLCFLGPVDGVWESIPCYLREGAIPRPTTQSQEWDGTGLPPVGCECEIATQYGWLPCRIVSHGKDYVVAHIHPNEHKLKVDWTCSGCRPIRTPEQRLREELAYVIKNAPRKPGKEIEAPDVVDAILAKYNLTEK